MLNNDKFDKSLFDKVSEELKKNYDSFDKIKAISATSPVGREIMKAKYINDDVKEQIFYIWYLRQFPYAGEDIWKSTPAAKHTWDEYLNMADLYFDEANNDNNKRCNVQTISNEKHLPKWNIEIIDSSAISSMLKDAEKKHLPFLKINASDDLKQKLEDYINQNPSKLLNSQDTFTCEPGNYIRTASNIGIQLVICNDLNNLVTFLNLVSPVDNKARVYQAKTFDHLFEDAPVIDKTEETVINGERGCYVTVKYADFSEGTDTSHTETHIVNYLFLGDKLRYLTDWNAFHIEEFYDYADGEDYSCEAQATVLRIESTEPKRLVHTFALP